ncbi:MAG: penicillin-binding protein 2, partial [Psychrobacter sp.]|nr:penicillin-binding protein 2 [Psychrobacter sp.]
KAALDKRHWDHAWFNGFAPVEEPEIALSVLVENGGGGSAVAAPIGRALFDYWMLQRKTNPILPPTADELRAIKRQKAFEKAMRDALRDKEQALAEKAEAQAAENAATSE